MEAKIIIPKFDNDGSDNSAEIESAIKTMCETFGGATVYDARGYWTNEAGRLFQDEVVVIVSAAFDVDDPEGEMEALARDLLDATDQEAVFIEVGDTPKIIK